MYSRAYVFTLSPHGDRRLVRDAHHDPCSYIALAKHLLVYCS